MTRFTIPDMSCDGYGASITRALQEIEADVSVMANLPRHAAETDDFSCATQAA